MAEDNWHHLEGTVVRPNLFRAYFYNDMTQPLPITGFSATVVATDASGRSIAAPVAAKAGRGADGNTLEASIPGMKLPASFELRVKFKPDDKEHVFDFSFAEYSKEPISHAAVSVPVTASITEPKPETRTPAPMRTPAVASQQSASSSSQPSDNAGGTTAQLLAQLAERSQSVAMLLAEGNLSGIWYPAIGAKDVALALEENHISELPEALRPKMASAVKRLTMAAWQIDAAGDLGSRERLQPLCRDFAAAVVDIQTVYATP